MNLNLFDFTEDDLKSNRHGFISPRQKEWLEGMAQGVRKTSQGNAWIALGFLIFGTCLIFGLYMQNERSHAAFFSSPGNLFVLPGTVVLVLGIIALSIFFARRQAHRLTGEQLQAADGKAHLEENSDGDFTSYLVFIGKKKFTFADEVSDIFREGEKYKVYYCRSGVYEFVMSYEHLST